MRILKYKITITGLAIFMVIVGLVGGASAQTPRINVFDNGNRWLITGYYNCSPVHQQAATQGICFLPYVQDGTCITGIWYSDTFGGWSGRYSQEGDRLRMHGNWGNDVGSDGMIIDLYAGTSPRDEGAGTWTEWFNGGPYGMTVAFGNARLRRVGRCQILQQNADISKMGQAELEKMADNLSRRVKPRLRKDGKPAESPTDPEQVPLPEEKDYQR
ncbi:MAG: hypothetical protein WCF57_20720 [Pyrinomonadaceae bacterium]